MDLNQVLVTSALGAAAAAMVKASPGRGARLRATLGLGGIWGGVTMTQHYFNSRGGSGTGTTATGGLPGVGVSPSAPTNPCEAGSSDVN